MSDRLLFYADPDLRPPVKIKSVSDTSITGEDGWSLGWDHEEYPAKVGDEVQFVRGSSVVRGAALNGEVCYYQTEEEWRTERQNTQEAKDRAERIEFYLEGEGHYDDMVKDQRAYDQLLHSYRLLPDVFQRRIQKFVGERDDWLRKFGSYEMSVCVDAVKVGDWFMNQEYEGGQEPDELYDLWKDPATQPLKLWDGHSGNSYGMAIRLGYWYATDPEMVVKEHGALVALVGCDGYGCPHPEASNG